MSNNLIAASKIIIILGLIMLTGCSVVAPRYQPDLDTVNDIKDLELKSMSTGKFTTATDDLNSISLRGSSLISPYNGSYSEYLKRAIIEQLRQAAIWDKNSTTVISGELLKNDVDPAMSAGESDLSARFIVHKNNNEVYNKIYSSHHQWPSSFAGAVAIPNAINNYSVSVQKLLSKFLLDKELYKALK